MSTLIAVYCGENCIGRCDERCYAAKGDDCDCICGGKLHQRGLSPALRAEASQIVKAMTQAEIAKFLSGQGRSEAEQQAMAGAIVVSRGPRSRPAAPKARRERQPREDRTEANMRLAGAFAEQIEALQSRKEG